MSEEMGKIIMYMNQIILGKEEVIERLLIALLCRGHILIEDVPGVGKTSMVIGLANTIGATFRRIQCTPDLLPSDLTGFSMYNPQKGVFEYKEGSLMASLILVDEINRTSPKTQASLLEAMEERQVTVDGQTYGLPDAFMVMATQNPIDQIGTYPLPEAQLDRFFMKINIGYPTEEIEKKILKQKECGVKRPQREAVVEVSDIKRLQERVDTIHIEESLQDMIVKITSRTRKHPMIKLGVSPRGSIHLMQAAKAYAMLKKRAYVLPDDIIAMVPDVLAHRIQLTHEAKLLGKTQKMVLSEMLQTIVIPRGTHYV